MKSDQASEDMSLKQPAAIRALLAAWLLLFFMFGLLTLKVYPPVNYNLTDEIWAMHSSTAFMEGRGESSKVTPRFYFGALGAFQSIAGKGVTTARAFSLMASVVVLYLTYLLGRELKDGYAGLLSSVLLGSTFAFSWHSRVIRSEILTAAFVVAAVYLLYYAFKREKHRYLFAGSLLAALSINVHPNSLQYALGIMPVFLIIFRRRAASVATLYFSGGLLAGFLVWLAISYFPSMPAGAATVGAVGGVHKVWPFPVLNENFFALLWKSLKALPEDYMQYIKLFDVFFPNKISIVLTVSAAACVWVLAMFTKERRRVLAILGLVASTNFIIYFITYRYGYWHMIEIYPFLAVAIVLGLCGIKEKLPRKAGMAVLFAWVLFFAGTGTADTVMTWYEVKDYDYEKFIARVSEKIDGKVMASDLYAPAFESKDFVQLWFNIDRPYRPSYWASGNMISEVYVFKAPE
jgi:hypothetical protein